MLVLCRYWLVHSRSATNKPPLAFAIQQPKNSKLADSPSKNQVQCANFKLIYYLDIVYFRVACHGSWCVAINLPQAFRSGVWWPLHWWCSRRWALKWLSRCTSSSSSTTYASRNRRRRLWYLLFVVPFLRNYVILNNIYYGLSTQYEHVCNLN